jgi:AraC family transcriptional regulator of adaptative response/methylated-DNA-[protein]-cysteine methyltransferase
LLRQSHDVLAAAHASGLSGPGRLHDLMIACDAVTPGEVRALGAGLEITYGFGLTPFGRVIAGTTQRGLCHLHFTTGDDISIAIAALHDEWPQARLLRDDSALAATIARLFAAGTLQQPQQAPLHLLLRGTNFQIKVWEALLKIPAGEIVSYQTLAAMIGNPRARRAVGTALAQNRIALLIPCHRVIRESGEIGQYRWGSERKNALLAFESASIRHQD